MELQTHDTQKNLTHNTEHLTLFQTDYLAYGEELTEPLQDNNGTILNKIGFTGHEHDYGTGFINMQARLQNPETGKFLSVDPGLDINFFDPMSWNRYLYVRCNPIHFNDPTGLTAESEQLTAKEKARLKFLVNSGKIKSPTSLLNSMDINDKKGSAIIFSVLKKTGLWETVDWNNVKDDVWSAAFVWSVSGNIEMFKEGVNNVRESAGWGSLLTSLQPQIAFGLAAYQVQLGMFVCTLGGSKKDKVDLLIDSVFLGLSEYAKLPEAEKLFNFKRVPTGKGLRWYDNVAKRFMKDKSAETLIKTVEKTNLGIAIMLNITSNKIKNNVKTND